MWKAAPYKGLGSRHRLGQLPQTVVDQAAKTVVDLAEPRVRTLIADERMRVARAGKAALPFVAISTAGFFATSFWTAPGKIKILGYTASAVALGVGLWIGFDILAERPEHEPTSEGPGIPLISESARQMARAIVGEAMPVIQTLAEEERSRFSSAVVTMLPYTAAATAGTLLTLFVVPKGSESVKVAGYTASAGALLLGFWHGLQTLTT